MKYHILLATLMVANITFSCNIQSAIAQNHAEHHTSSGIQIGDKPMDSVVSSYLQIKNALASDNPKGAVNAGTQLKTFLVNLGKQPMDKAQKKAYKDIADNAVENAEHIADNGGKIKHQREHFEDLSADIYDLVKAFGASQTLYKEYCPMKKASWLSESKDIKNPYFGKSMPACGSVKETIDKK